jgi:hypothetical protein
MPPAAPSSSMASAKVCVEVGISHASPHPPIQLFVQNNLEINRDMKSSEVLRVFWGKSDAKSNCYAG